MCKILTCHWKPVSGSSEQPTPGKQNMLWSLMWSCSCLLPALAVMNVECVSGEPRPRKYKCGLSAPCPPKHLAFRLVSGAANVIAPKVCLEDQMWGLVLNSCLLIYVTCFFSPLCFFFLPILNAFPIRLVKRQITF